MFVVGNNPNRAHNYFQDFWKCFSILNKAQQIQLNRKQKQIKKKRGRSPPRPYLCWPAHLARPSRLAMPVVVLLAPEGRGARGRRPAATRRPPPASADARAALGHHVTPPRTPLVLAHSPLPWIPLFPSPRP